jgi:hypothetical protein
MRFKRHRRHTGHCSTDCSTVLSRNPIAVVAIVVTIRFGPYPVCSSERRNILSRSRGVAAPVNKAEAVSWRGSIAGFLT